MGLQKSPIRVEVSAYNTVFLHGHVTTWRISAGCRSWNLIVFFVEPLFASAFPYMVQGLGILDKVLSML